jgi:Fur family ferric uptake transcriptional regulator
MAWAINILKQHGLKKTEARITALEHLKSKNSAVSHNDLEQAMGDGTDRVTLYRILKTFEEKGIIHAIYGQKNGTQYALCHDCKEHHHTDNHLHFNCLNCHQTFCIENVPVLSPELPPGFRINNLQLIAEGSCKACSENH